MSIMLSVASIGLKQAVGDGCDVLVRTLNDRFSDQSQRLPRAIQTASERAWKALEIALAGDTFWNRFDRADDRAFRANLKAFLENVSLPMLTGKGEFRRLCLRELRAGTFFDADRAVHLLHGDSEVRGLVTREFGAQAYSASGDLNRAWIRGIVFADAEKKRALEQILHPRIRRQWAAEAERWRNSHDLFFADIPLLYETGGETLCDRVVVVACSSELQLERLMERMSLSP